MAPLINIPALRAGGASLDEIADAFLAAAFPNGPLPGLQANHSPILRVPMVSSGLPMHARPSQNGSSLSFRADAPPSSPSWASIPEYISNGSGYGTRVALPPTALHTASSRLKIAEGTSYSPPERGYSSTAEAAGGETDWRLRRQQTKQPRVMTAPSPSSDDASGLEYVRNAAFETTREEMDWRVRRQMERDTPANTAPSHPSYSPYGLGKKFHLGIFERDWDAAKGQTWRQRVVKVWLGTPEALTSTLATLEAQNQTWKQAGKGLHGPDRTIKVNAARQAADFHEGSWRAYARSYVETIQAGLGPATNDQGDQMQVDEATDFGEKFSETYMRRKRVGLAPKRNWMWQLAERWSGTSDALNETIDALKLQRTMWNRTKKFTAKRPEAERVAAFRAAGFDHLLWEAHVQSYIANTIPELGFEYPDWTRQSNDEESDGDDIDTEDGDHARLSAGSAFPEDMELDETSFRHYSKPSATGGTFPAPGIVPLGHLPSENLAQGVHQKLLGKRLTRENDGQDDFTEQYDFIKRSKH